MKALCILAACAVLGGCGFVHDEPLDGPYRLVAVDSREQMMLCRTLAAGNCVGDGLPGPTVFGAGANREYLVIARHPLEQGPSDARIDRSRTEFFYVVRADETSTTPGELIGPLDEQAFVTAATELDLPQFTRIFADLK